MKRSPSPESKPLVYSIAASTQHSGKYVPKNIMVDRPQDQSSRWSSALQGKNNQWIMLRLESLAVLKTITFGKFSKAHPCNVKELKVLAGMAEDSLTEVLHIYLKNDAVPETFHLKHANSSGVPFPARYVKITPISAHAPNFHISLWHVALSGVADEAYVENVRAAYDEFREAAVMRFVLKHLRQRRLLTPYQDILSRTNFQLEHPLVTQFHEELVLQGDWAKSEEQLLHMGSAGLFDTQTYTHPPHAVWTRLLGTDADGDLPPARGGHSMCVDPVNEIIYIFGGWSGTASLDDFWAYSVREDKWKVLSHSTTNEQNAPGARSCHKMVFDTKTGCIYLLGRLTDEDEVAVSVTQSARSPLQGHIRRVPQQPPDEAQPSRAPCSEFYRYHTRGVLAGKWDFLSIDTASSGGPPLIFDHQMVMDSESQILYVSGGRIVDGESPMAAVKYSGLYSYNVATSKWKLHLPTDSAYGSVEIPGRYGHSMVLDADIRTLFIFAGKKEDKYLSDMYAYNIDTGVATEIFSDFTSAGGPPACFTQRAVIDTSLKEIYIIFGIMKEPGSPETVARAPLANWVYNYSTSPGTWLHIRREPGRAIADLPSPRFAHQVAYIPSTKSLFLHGGNAGQGFSEGAYHEFVFSTAVATNPALALVGALNPALAAPAPAVEPLAEGDAPSTAEETEDADSPERRLDDFWRMDLERPGPEETIRRAKFEIRKQQYREMCEDGPPIKALSFLQTQVSETVNHNDAKETEVFRALLTHLLSPPKQVAAATSGVSVASAASSSSGAATVPVSASTSSSISTSTSHGGGSGSPSSLEHEDTRELSNRPQKRSRGEEGSWSNSAPETPTTPSGPGSSTASGSSTTTRTSTSTVHESTIQAESNIHSLCNTVDALEAQMRGDNASTLSGERYKQRTEVFENILKLVAESEKQPTESLLDLIEQRDRCHAQGLGRV